MLRFTNLCREFYRCKSIMVVLITSISTLTLLAFFFMRIDYKAPVGWPSLQIGNSELQAGESRWVWGLPGRRLSYAATNQKPTETSVYPWRRNRLIPPACVVVVPNFDISGIDTGETAEELRWEAMIVVKRPGSESHNEQIKPYQGGPIVFKGIPPTSPVTLDDPMIKRKEQLIQLDVLLFPSDSLTIEIRGQGQEYFANM